MQEQITKWKSPLKNWRMLSPIGSEVTPFIFKNRLYRIENFKRAEDFPGKDLKYRFHEDGFRIRDVEQDLIISVPLLNHYFATAFVWNDRVYVFTGNYGDMNQKWWHIKTMEMISSDGRLETWTKPVPVLQAEGDEHIYNNSVCWDGKRFIMLYETDDKQWTPFTFKFCESEDLAKWKRIPNAIYGKDKYVGGPALYFRNGYYYAAYLKELGNVRYETHLTRSKDLINWEDATADRPFLTFNPERKSPEYCPGFYESNASDVDMCEWKGKVLVYWNGGDQTHWGDLQAAEYDGALAELLEMFFK